MQYLMSADQLVWTRQAATSQSEDLEILPRSDEMMRLSIRLRLQWWFEPFGLLIHHFEASFLEHQSPSLSGQLEKTSKSASA